MIRKVLLCLFSLLFSIAGYSQSIVSGRVSDAETKAALEKAIVKVLNDKRQLIAYTITDKEGAYSVKIKSS